MSNITPLPWVATPTSPGGRMALQYSQPFAVAQADEGLLVAGCFGDTAGGMSAAEDNAHLIVRAVNHHQSLVNALTVLCSRFDSQFERGVKVTRRHVAEARAALPPADQVST